jgi:hypothetical protein
MWALNDKYSSPPYFRFRFKNTSADDVIYKMLNDIVEGFKGNLQWEMVYDEKKSASFFILPKAFSSFVFKDNFVFEKKSFLNLLPLDDYKSTIDQAIIDVPHLTGYIAEQYKRKASKLL